MGYPARFLFAVLILALAGCTREPRLAPVAHLYIADSAGNIVRHHEIRGDSAAIQKGIEGAVEYISLTRSPGICLHVTLIASTKLVVPQAQTMQALDKQLDSNDARGPMFVLFADENGLTLYRNPAGDWFAPLSEWILQDPNESGAWRNKLSTALQLHWKLTVSMVEP